MAAFVQGVGLLQAGCGTGLLPPLFDLLEGLGQGADDYGGTALAEALDGLVEVVGGVPEADADTVFGQVRADALADSAGL